MDKVWEIFVSLISSVEFWKILIPTLLALCVWVLTEHSKARWEQFKLKEGNYKAIIASLKPLYDPSPASLTEFLRQIDLAWLYAPDSIIRKMYSVIEIIRNTGISSDQKNDAFSELVYDLRQDMLRRKIDIIRNKIAIKFILRLRIATLL
jgi:hypothetical protein